MAVVKFNPDVIRKDQLGDNKEDRIDILSRKVSIMENTLERMAENVNKMGFTVKTNSELIETLEEKALRISEATCDNFNKTEEKIEGVMNDISSIRLDVSSLENKIHTTNTTIISGSTSNVSNGEAVKTQKEISVETDELFWSNLITEAYALSSRNNRKKKPEIAHIFAGRYGYGEQLWLDILGYIWTARRAKRSADDVAKDLDRKHKLTVKKTVDIWKEVNNTVDSATTPTENVNTSNTTEADTPLHDSFIDILQMMGYEILDTDVRYTVKDAGGRTCEVSRRVFEASMNDIFKTKEVE